MSIDEPNTFDDIRKHVFWFLHNQIQLWEILFPPAKMYRWLNTVTRENEEWVLCIEKKNIIENLFFTIWNNVSYKIFLDIFFSICILPSEKRVHSSQMRYSLIWSQSLFWICVKHSCNFEWQYFYNRFKYHHFSLVLSEIPPQSIQ